VFAAPELTISQILAEATIAKVEKGRFSQGIILFRNGSLLYRIENGRAF